MSDNPNATVSKSANSLQWWPSYLTSKIKPTCQPTSLPVNTQFFTNQTALVYTLASVWRNNTTSPAVSPSLAYLNHVLQDCKVASIQIDVESYDRAANQQALTEWGAKVRTSATCQIATEAGIFFVNLTQTYDYVPETVTFTQISTVVGSGPVSRDKDARASLWWGESLMSTYWVQLTWLLQNETRMHKYDEWPIRKGSLYFVPQPGKAIDDVHFFQFSGQFVEATSPGDYKSNRVTSLTIRSDQIIENYIRGKTYPNIWAPADNLAKSAYATILTDLGQAPTATLLTDAALLQSFTANFPAIHEANQANAFPGPANRSYDELRNQTGPLAVTPSVISAQYICQVPRQRPMSSLVMAVLVADLVFLQAAWQLYKLATGVWLTRQSPDSDWCQGCLDMKARRDPKLVEVESATSDDNDTASGRTYELVRQRDVEGEAIRDGGQG